MPQSFFCNNFHTSLIDASQICSRQSSDTLLRISPLTFLTDIPVLCPQSPSFPHLRPPQTQQPWLNKFPKPRETSLGFSNTNVVPPPREPPLRRPQLALFTCIAICMGTKRLMLAPHATLCSAIAPDTPLNISPLWILPLHPADAPPSKVDG
jgi:hypothetical protein